ncbi:MAG TPA: LysR family transcriptional regulator, partial [Devosia sp.]|nr:LysR family transcriptional regulator [Devosia sp.]
LFERVGRGLMLTPAGHELLAHVRRMGEAATHMSLTAAGRSQSIEGLVRISATDIYASALLPRFVARLRSLEPRVRVEVITTNNFSDLRRREADIAIRNAPPTQPDLIARKIAQARANLYASNSYMAANGPFRSPGDLNRADFVEMDASLKGADTLNAAFGLSLARENFPVVSENMQVAWELVKQGAGIGIMDEHIGENEPLVQRALPTLSPITFPIWLVAHRELTSSRRLRRVFDLLVKYLIDEKKDGRA